MSKKLHFDFIFILDNKLCGLPGANLHNIKQLSVFLLNDNHLKCLPFAMTTQQPAHFTVFNNQFSAFNHVVPKPKETFTLYHYASTVFARSKWYVLSKSSMFI